jgi:hypothetical protein
LLWMTILPILGIFQRYVIYIFCFATKIGTPQRVQPQKKKAIRERKW